MLQTDWISNFCRLLFTHIDEKCFQEKKKAHLGKKNVRRDEVLHSKQVSWSNSQWNGNSVFQHLYTNYQNNYWILGIEVIQLLFI